MKKSRFLKAMSVVALSATLFACGKTKTVKEEWTDEELAKWATDNGYVVPMTEAEKNAWAIANGYEKWTDEARAQWAKENGYIIPEEELDYDTVPTLEVAFGETYTELTFDDLQKKLNQKHNVAVVIGAPGCGGCSKLKEEGILDAFVEETGYKLYYVSYNADDVDWTDETDTPTEKIIKQVFGSKDAVTTPTLVAYTEPQDATASVSAVSNKWDVTEHTTAQIKEKLETVFTFETEEFEAFRAVADLAEIKTAGNLVKEVASGNESIMFFSRYGCGSCQVLQHTGTNWNFITRLFKDIKVEDGKNFKFIALVSENIQRSVVDASGKTFGEGVKAVYDAAVANQTLSEEARITWFKKVLTWDAEAGKFAGAPDYNADRIAEFVMYAVALGQIKVTADMVTTEGYLTPAFWTAVETWADSDAQALQDQLGLEVINVSKGSQKLYQGERLIPAFLAVNYQEWSNKWVVTKPSSNDQNAPINNFYDLPRELGVKTTGAVGYPEFVDYLYARTKMYIETWVNYGTKMTGQNVQPTPAE